MTAKAAKQEAKAALFALAARLTWKHSDVLPHSTAQEGEKLYSVGAFTSPFLTAPIWLAAHPGGKRQAASHTRQEAMNDCEVHAATGRWPRKKALVTPQVPLVSSTKHFTPEQQRAIEILKGCYFDPRSPENRRFMRDIIAQFDEDKAPLTEEQSKMLLILLHRRVGEHWACCCPKCRAPPVTSAGR